MVRRQERGSRQAALRLAAGGGPLGGLGHLAQVVVGAAQQPGVGAGAEGRVGGVPHELEATREGLVQGRLRVGDPLQVLAPGRAHGGAQAGRAHGPPHLPDEGGPPGVLQAPQGGVLCRGGGGRLSYTCGQNMTFYFRLTVLIIRDDLQIIKSTTIRTMLKAGLYRETFIKVHYPGSRKAMW